MIDRLGLNLAALALLALLAIFFTSVHELSMPDYKTEPVRTRASKSHPYCHVLPLPFFRQLDDDYFDVWPEFGCAHDLVPERLP